MVHTPAAAADLLLGDACGERTAEGITGWIAANGDILILELEAVPLSAIESLGQLIARTPGAKGDLPRNAIEALAKGGPPLVKTRAKELLIKLGPN